MGPQLGEAERRHHLARRGLRRPGLRAPHTTTAAAACPTAVGAGLGGQARHAESQAGKRPSRAELRPRLVTRFWSVSQATSSHASLAKASHAAEPGAVGIYRVISQEADSEGA